MVRFTQSKDSSNKPRQGRDPEATKVKILDAAEAEFAKYGLAGARTEAIADRTGATKAMIYYYFENKEGLYKAVMCRLVTELHETFQQLNLEELPVKQALEELVRAVIAYEASNPHRGMLWFHEAIQNQGKYGELTGWQESFKDMMNLLQRGMTERVFRQLDPFLTTINIIAVCTFYFSAHENMKYVNPDRQLLSPGMIEQQTQEAINLILLGVEA